MAKLLFSDNPVIEGLPVRDVILGSSNCSTIEECHTMMQAPSMDSRSWGGWAEIVLLAAKWKVGISLFWRQSHSEAFYSIGPEGQHLMCDQPCFSTRAANITTVCGCRRYVRSFHGCMSAVKRVRWWRSLLKQTWARSKLDRISKGVHFVLKGCGRTVRRWWILACKLENHQRMQDVSQC